MLPYLRNVAWVIRIILIVQALVLDYVTLVVLQLAMMDVKVDVKDAGTLAVVDVVLLVVKVVQQLAVDVITVVENAPLLAKEIVLPLVQLSVLDSVLRVVRHQ